MAGNTVRAHSLYGDMTAFIPGAAGAQHQLKGSFVSQLPPRYQNCAFDEGSCYIPGKPRSVYPIYQTPPLNNFIHYGGSSSGHCYNGCVTQYNAAASQNRGAATSLDASNQLRSVEPKKFTDFQEFWGLKNIIPDSEVFNTWLEQLKQKIRSAPIHGYLEQLLSTWRENAACGKDGSIMNSFLAWIMQLCYEGCAYTADQLSAIKTPDNAHVSAGTEVRHLNSLNGSFKHVGGAEDCDTHWYSMYEPHVSFLAPRHSYYSGNYVVDEVNKYLDEIFGEREGINYVENAPAPPQPTQLTGSPVFDVINGYLDKQASEKFGNYDRDDWNYPTHPRQAARSKRTRQSCSCNCDESGPMAPEDKTKRITESPGTVKNILVPVKLKPAV